MVTTKLIRGINSKALHNLAGTRQTRFIALGNFDGLHRGHRQLLKSLKEYTSSFSNAICSVVSFYPHPALVLGKTKLRRPLTTLRQRLDVLAELGFDELIMLRFSSAFSQLSAAHFIDQLLIDRLHVHTLCVGPDATIGKGREADVEGIRRLLEAQQAHLLIVPHLTIQEKKIGTRAIRDYIQNGAITLANEALGVPYSLYGRVVRGDGRGKRISIPTANLASKQSLPKYGVYVGLVHLGSECHRALINIGERPTFKGQGARVEAHLYDYQGADFYQQRISIDLLERVRDEQRFAAISELVSQIKRDIEWARSYFN
jgi:riboflavin kinase/FMN adenylyltransferase